MDKELLTPGKLYARLSEEFRNRQQMRCHGCRMPMVFLRERPGDDPANWSVDSTTSACEQCQALIDDVVRRHATLFDLWDPTAIYAGRPLAVFAPSVGQRPQ